MLNSNTNSTVAPILITLSPLLPRCPLPAGGFVGRSVELSKLVQFFFSEEMRQRVFVLIGMGGCGKSQIAFQFFHYYVLLKKDRYVLGPDFPF